MNAMSFCFEKDPQHRILENACEYEIIGLRIELYPIDGSESFIDLTLRKDHERKIFRFWSPQEIEIERGGPANTGGLQILDVSSRGLERLGVQVIDFEASHGAVRFFARTVEKLNLISD